MIMIKNFNDFLLEAKIEYFSKFEDILLMMRSPIANYLLDLKGKNVNVNVNYLNLTDKEDFISFIQDDKVGDGKSLYEFIQYPYNIIDSISLRSYFGIDRPKYVYPQIGTIGWISNRITDISKENLRNFGVYSNVQSDIVHFVDLNGGDFIVEMNNLKQLDKLNVNINSQESRIGRLVRKVVSSSGGKFSDREYEEFVTEFKSKIEISKNNLRNIEIVSGEDIRKYYLESNYDMTKSSTLQNSCMRYFECQNYFDIYVKNPQVCQMLIRRSDSNPSKITSRALIWTLVSGEKVMDRIYYSKEQEQNILEEWAKSNEIYYHNKSMDLFNFKGQKERNFDLEVKLSIWGFDHYPYMDTMKYLDSENGILYDNVSSEKAMEFYFLEDQDGGYIDPNY